MKSNKYSTIFLALIVLSIIVMIAAVTTTVIIGHSNVTCYEYMKIPYKVGHSVECVRY